MADSQTVYRITVEYAGRKASSVVPERQVEEWLGLHGAGHLVTGTLRALMRALRKDAVVRMTGLG